MTRALLLALALLAPLPAGAEAPRPTNLLAPLAAPTAAAPPRTVPRRLLAAHEQQRYRGVGRLDLGDGYCTATLFSARLALTAAHCLYDAAGRPRPLADLRFRAGFREGGQQAVRAVRRAAVHPDWRWTGRRVRPAEVARDVALLELDAPLLTTDFPHYLPGDPPSSGSAVALLSYGRGRDRALSLQDPCHVTGRAGGTLRLSCEAAPGSSGAPVLVRDGAGHRLVGVVAAAGGGVSFAVPAAAALPALEAALAGLGPRRETSRPGGSLISKPGAWKASRPPAAAGGRLP